MALSMQNCNLSNSTILLTDLQWSSTEKVSILAILPTLMSIGDVTNLAFLYTVVTIPRMHTVANIYLANLAITDMLFVSQATISYVIVYLMTPIRNAAIQTQAGCWLAFLPSVLFYYVSLAMVFLVSMERYYAVCQPLKHRAFTKLGRAKTHIVISWLIGFIFAVPSTLTWGDITSINICTRKLDVNELPMPYIQTLYICQMKHPHQTIINLIAELIPSTLFCVTLIASCVLYVKVLININTQTKTTMKSSKTHIAKVKNQIARVLIINGILFFICQIPYRMNSIHEILSDNKVWSLPEDNRQLLIIFSRLSLYINSTINPFVYGAGSRYYRNAFFEAFGLCASKESNSSHIDRVKSFTPRQLTDLSESNVGTQQRTISTSIS
ncbi:neuropeptides capa receptor-like [Amphiura filiformis]|uniref:neuropeptides capa receptor-like n=1 Tax=Amphiura filiformis TaxID=82378 RepID=UPI003B21B55C